MKLVSYPKNQINDDLATGTDELHRNTDGETGDEVRLRRQGLPVQSVKIPIGKEEVINDVISVEIIVMINAAANAMITNVAIGITMIQGRTETMIDHIEITRGLIEIRIGLIVNQVTTIRGIVIF